jgi:hypothetical protein
MDEEGPEDDEAFDEFWGERLDEADELSPELEEQSTAMFDTWTFFDRPLADGRTMAQTLLARGQGLAAGERTFLQAMSTSAMHLWEITDVEPGLSLTLRDVLEGRTVVVHEKSGSRTLARHDWLAARVIPRGASGSPEIEHGAAHIPALFHDSVRKQLTDERAAFLRDHPEKDLDTFFYKNLGPYFHDLWVGAILDPPVPQLHNTEGHPLLTRVSYHVQERAAPGPSARRMPSAQRRRAAPRRTQQDLEL